MRSAYVYDACPAVQERAAHRSRIRGRAKDARAAPGTNPIVNTCFRYLVSGRVQGVYFRATTRERALRFGLTGWVRNRSDGAVEVLACGDEANVAELEAWLRRGPAHARVVSVEREPADPEVCRGFEIR